MHKPTAKRVTDRSAQESARQSVISSNPNGKEWGREIELSYTVQSDSLKNLNVRLRNASIRRDYSSNEFDDNRVIVNYPFSLF